jgi:hypothetical protein
MHEAAANGRTISPEEAIALEAVLFFAVDHPVNVEHLLPIAREWPRGGAAMELEGMRSAQLAGGLTVRMTVEVCHPDYPGRVIRCARIKVPEPTPLPTYEEAWMIAEHLGFEEREGATAGYTKEVAGGRLIVLLQDVNP